MAHKTNPEAHRLAMGLNTILASSRNQAYLLQLLLRQLNEVIMGAVEEQGVDLPARAQWSPQKACLRPLAWLMAKE